MNRSSNPLTSGVALTRELCSLRLTPSITKTGRNTSGISGNIVKLVFFQEIYSNYDRYYQAYLEFFTAEVKVKSYGTILEEYIFSPGANFVKGAGKQPEMLTRFFDSLLHPFIHVGLAIEFDLPGIFAEGTDIQST